jgi:hypothetical protein
VLDGSSTCCSAGRWQAIFRHRLSRAPDAPEKKLFASRGLVRWASSWGSILVLVDPWAYDRIDSLDTRLMLGRAVGGSTTP